MFKVKQGSIKISYPRMPALKAAKLLCELANSGAHAVDLTVYTHPRDIAQLIRVVEAEDD